MQRYAILIFLLAIACTAPEGEGEGRKSGLKIVCTTGMIGDAVRAMTDSTCTVDVLMGPGTDPHLFKPTKTSLDLLAGADIIVANGLHLEGRMQEILHKMERSKRVLLIGETVSTDNIIYAGKAGDLPDPHIWFDVALWAECTQNLADSLDGSGCLNRRKADAYISKLEELDTWVAGEIAEIPKNQRVLITAHDAFSYFGKAYDIEVLGLQGISTVAEYGVRDISNMVETIMDRRIKSIFVETSISSRSVEAVIAGCRERGFALQDGGTLYSDALGPEGSGAATYIEMVRHDVNTIKSALK